MHSHLRTLSAIAIGLTTALAFWLPPLGNRG